VPNDLQPAVVPVEKVDILIVDDLPEKLLVLQTVLEELGENVVLARSGTEALRLVLKQEFAVILLDVHMPDIDGIETAGLIRQYRKAAHTPIIFITAYADELQTRRGYELGAVDYIYSPVVPQVLRSKVRVFAELYRMQQRIREQAEARIALVQAEAARAAAEENTRRINFLAQAAHELSGSLEATHCANRLLELLVPEFSPLAVLMLSEGDAGRMTLLQAAAPAQGRMRLSGGSAVPAALVEQMAAAILGTAEVPADGSRLAFEPVAPEWQGRLQLEMLLPLRIGRRTLGALAIMGRDGQPPDPRDLATVRQLAERAATAFENARLYGDLQREIVERREAERKLADASHRKDEFLAMLSHELRNPLAPIRSALEVMRRIDSAHPTLLWAQGVIDRQAAHLTHLVDELLDVARITQGKVSIKKEPLQLSTLLNHAVETTQPLISSRRHELVLNIPEQPVWVLGDFTRLGQVIANLLNNAAKYTPEGGRIELSAAPAGSNVLISVRDDGIGIEPELLARVFDLFVQGEQSLDRRQGGLGVGLTLVQKLVELHGGRIEARSGGRDRGSEFVVTLPVLSMRPDFQDALPPVPSAAAQARRVLVVDDNEDAADAVAMFLRLQGHTVEVATDGLEACNRAKLHLPEIVILDLGLPTISGYEVARRLREAPETRAIILIALTGYGQPDDVSRTMAAGFDCHLTKPVEPAQIVDMIANWTAYRRSMNPAVPAMATATVPDGASP
jgi:signal transduction histidine kinase